MVEVATLLSTIPSVRIAVVGVLEDDGQFTGGTGSDETLDQQQRDGITEALKKAMYGTVEFQKPEIDAARCLRSLRAHLVSIRTISAELDPQAAQRQREMIDLCLAYVQDLKKAIQE